MKRYLSTVRIPNYLGLIELVFPVEQQPLHPLFSKIKFPTHPTDDWHSKEKYFAYRVTPSLKIYNDPIWTEHADHWVQPVGSWIIQNIKDPFYVFKDELGEPFIDHHPKPSSHLEWLVKFLIPKLGIDPQLERYKQISDQSDILQAKNINNEKKSFEKLLFREKFDLPAWPNMIKGFVTF